MNHDDKEADEYANRLADRLRASEHDIDAETLARLGQARREAVAMSEQRSRSRHKQYWLGAGGAAVAASLLVVMLNTGQVDPLPDADPEEFAAAQDIEMLEELEFIAWVASLEEIDDPSQG